MPFVANEFHFNARTRVYLFDLDDIGRVLLRRVNADRSRNVPLHFREIARVEAE